MDEKERDGNCSVKISDQGPESNRQPVNSCCKGPFSAVLSDFAVA
jgi:hypothetical protein